MAGRDCRQFVYSRQSRVRGCASPRGGRRITSEDHRRRGGDPSAACARRRDRRREPGRPRCARPHRRGDHRNRRGRLGTRGGAGDDQRARLSRDCEQPARSHRRRGPARCRAPLAQDVPRPHLRRPPRHRAPRDQRHRHRSLGHQGEGAREAGVRADRDAAARPCSGVRLAADARHARRGSRRRVGVARAGLHRRQARLGAARRRRRPRPCPRGRGLRGRRRRGDDPDRRRPRLRGGRRRRRSGSHAGSRSSGSSGSRSRSSRTSTRPTPSSPTQSTSGSPPASRTRRSGASAS